MTPPPTLRPRKVQETREMFVSVIEKSPAGYSAGDLYFVLSGTSKG
jgi:hypothetical protein